MADRVIVVCSSCSAKLALPDESKLGKKIRCPKCSEVFVAEAAKVGGSKSSAPTKSAKPKPKKSDEDEFNFDDSEMEDSSEQDEEESRPVRAKAGAKKGAKGTGKSKSSGGNMPIMIGGSVALVVLLGVGGYFLFGRGGAEPAPAPVQPVAQAAVAPPAAAPVADSPADKILSLKWLPAETEGIVHLKVGELFDAPLLKSLTSNPQVQGPLQMMQQMSGLTPSDIESVTLATRDFSNFMMPGMQMAQPPGAPGGAPGFGPPGAGGPPPGFGGPPSQFGPPGAGGGMKQPAVFVVVKTKKPTDPQKLTDLLVQSAPKPEMAKVEDRNGKKYVSLQDGLMPPMAVYFVDASTAIAGNAADVIAAIDRGETSTPRAEFRALDPSPQILFAVAGKPVTSATQNIPPAPPTAPPAVVELLNAAKQSLTAASFGVSIKGGFELQTGMVFSQSGNLSKVQGSVDLFLSEVKPKLEAARSTTPPLVTELLEMLITNLKVTEQGTAIKIATNIPDSAQQKLEQLPLILAGAALTGGNPLQSLLAGTPLGAAQGAAAQQRQKNNLKMIGLAMHNYHDTFKTFPAASSVDASGKSLLSWRVHLLPYLDQAPLYKQFKLDEPWDSDHNKTLIDKMPAVFGDADDPSGAALGQTRFVVPFGTGLAFEGTTGLGVRDFADGTSNTINAVEVAADAAVTWTQPDDLAFDSNEPHAKLQDARNGGFLALMADGAVRFVADSVMPDTLKALFTRKGGEPVGNF